MSDNEKYLNQRSVRQRTNTVPNRVVYPPVGTGIAVAGLALFALAMRMCFKEPKLALRIVCVAAFLASVFSLFGTDMSNPLAGLIVIAVGCSIGNASRKRDEARKDKDL